MSSETSVGLDSSTADELRQVARELGAQQRRTFTLAQAIAALIESWRQSGAGQGAA